MTINYLKRNKPSYSHNHDGNINSRRYINEDNFHEDLSNYLADIDIEMLFESIKQEIEDRITNLKRQLELINMQLERKMAAEGSISQQDLLKSMNRKAKQRNVSLDVIQKEYESIADDKTSEILKKEKDSIEREIKKQEKARDQQQWHGEIKNIEQEIVDDVFNIKIKLKNGTFVTFDDFTRTPYCIVTEEQRSKMLRNFKAGVKKFILSITRLYGLGTIPASSRYDQEGGGRQAPLEVASVSGWGRAFKHDALLYIRDTLRYGLACDIKTMIDHMENDFAIVEKDIYIRYKNAQNNPQTAAAEIQALKEEYKQKVQAYLDPLPQNRRRSLERVLTWEQRISGEPPPPGTLSGLVTGIGSSSPIDLYARRTKASREAASLTGSNEEVVWYIDLLSQMLEKESIDKIKKYKKEALPLTSSEYLQMGIQEEKKCRCGICSVDCTDVHDPISKEKTENQKIASTVDHEKSDENFRKIPCFSSDSTCDRKKQYERMRKRSNGGNCCEHSEKAEDLYMMAFAKHENFEDEVGRNIIFRLIHIYKTYCKECEGTGYIQDNRCEKCDRGMRILKISPAAKKALFPLTATATTTTTTTSDKNQVNVNEVKLGLMNSLKLKYELSYGENPAPMSEQTELNKILSRPIYIPKVNASTIQSEVSKKFEEIKTKNLEDLNKKIEFENNNIATMRERVASSLGVSDAKLDSKIEEINAPVIEKINEIRKELEEENPMVSTSVIEDEAVQRHNIKMISIPNKALIGNEQELEKEIEKLISKIEDLMGDQSEYKQGLTIIQLKKPYRKDIKREAQAAFPTEAQEREIFSELTSKIESKPCTNASLLKIMAFWLQGELGTPSKGATTESKNQETELPDIKKIQKGRLVDMIHSLAAIHQIAEKDPNQSYFVASKWNKRFLTCPNCNKLQHVAPNSKLETEIKSKREIKCEYCNHKWNPTFDSLRSKTLTEIMINAEIQNAKMSIEDSQTAAILPSHELIVNVSNPSNRGTPAVGDVCWYNLKVGFDPREMKALNHCGNSEYGVKCPECNWGKKDGKTCDRCEGKGCISYERDQNGNLLPPGGVLSYLLDRGIDPDKYPMEEILSLRIVKKISKESNSGSAKPIATAILHYHIPGSTETDPIGRWIGEFKCERNQRPSNLVQDEKITSVKCSCGSKDYQYDGEKDEYTCSKCNQKIEAKQESIQLSKLILASATALLKLKDEDGNPYVRMVRGVQFDCRGSLRTNVKQNFCLYPRGVEDQLGTTMTPTAENLSGNYWSDLSITQLKKIHDENPQVFWEPRKDVTSSSPSDAEIENYKKTDFECQFCKNYYRSVFENEIDTWQQVLEKELQSDMQSQVTLEIPVQRTKEELQKLNIPKGAKPKRIFKKGDPNTIDGKRIIPPGSVNNEENNPDDPTDPCTYKWVRYRKIVTPIKDKNGNELKIFSCSNPDCQDRMYSFRKENNCRICKSQYNTETLEHGQLVDKWMDKKTQTEVSGEIPRGGVTPDNSAMVQKVEEKLKILKSLKAACLSEYIDKYLDIKTAPGEIEATKQAILKADKKVDKVSVEGESAIRDYLRKRTEKYIENSARVLDIQKQARKEDAEIKKQEDAANKSSGGTKAVPPPPKEPM